MTRPDCCRTWNAEQVGASERLSASARDLGLSGLFLGACSTLPCAVLARGDHDHALLSGKNLHHHGPRASRAAPEGGQNECLAVPEMNGSASGSSQQPCGQWDRRDLLHTDREFATLGVGGVGVRAETERRWPR